MSRDDYDRTLPRVGVNDEDLPADWWQRSPATAHLCALARSRRVAPIALLGCVLALVTASAHNLGVTLPPPIGNGQPITLRAVVVGPPGSGKSAAFLLARQALSSAWSGSEPAQRLLVEVRDLRDADRLLQRSDVTGGRHQLWLPTVDSDAPDDPAEPDDGQWHPLNSPTFAPEAPLRLSRTIVADVDNAWLPVLRGDEDDGSLKADAEWTFNVLGIAVALALLDLRTDVTDDDWQRARPVEFTSGCVWDRVSSALAYAKKEADSAQKWSDR